MKKRIVAVGAIAASAALLISGCSASGSSDSRELTITWKNTESAGLNALLPEYQKLNPDLNITLSVGDSTALATTTRTQLSAGTASDIIWLWAGIGNPLSVGIIGEAGLLTDLSDQPWAEKFPDYVNPLTQYDDGKTGMLPMDITSFDTYYNQDAVDAAGLTIPITWDEVLTFCADARDAGVVAYTFGPATINESQNIVYNLAPTLVYGPDPEFEPNLQSGSDTFADNAGWTETLEKYQDMLEGGCFPDNLTGQASAQSITLVSQGGALAMPTVGFSLAALQTEGPDVNWTWAPIPATNDPDEQYITASITGGPGVSANANHPDEAKKFLAWLAEPEQMNKYVAALAGTIPSITNDDFVADANLAKMLEYVESGHAVTFLNHYWTNPALEATMQKDLQAMLIGTMTVPEVLADMTKVYDTAP